jgi:hypothetical protein
MTDTSLVKFIGTGGLSSRRDDNRVELRIVCGMQGRRNQCHATTVAVAKVPAAARLPAVCSDA